ncbi:PAS domain-containing sensor histidine kinase [Motiliproteus sediminis]|uniref:PAS domain-containing sensor histidine kinase n=1 Tax=Motiliproteus sediminis TaxID=1468178 RepID=UPI001AEF8C91|nr:PAS domain-containing sensor histidine kinase [Motiliproteus sediminis]
MKDFSSPAARVRFWNDDPRVKAIVGSAADGIIGIDTRGMIEMFNPAAEKLFGYNADDVIGRNVKYLAAPEYQRDHDQYLRNYLESATAKVIGIGREVKGQRKDGSLFPMYLSVGEIKIDGFHGFVGIAHDLSALHAARQQLAVTGELLQNIIDSMPSIIIGVDAEGHITHWNQLAAAEPRLAQPLEVGQRIDQCYPHLTNQLSRIETAILEQRTLVSQRISVPRDGEVGYVDVMVYPLAQGASAGAVIRIDDITERVRIEEMMIQTEKMMSVGGLAAGMAHEINNPLGIIAQGCQNLTRRLSAELPQNRQLADELGLDLALVERYMEQRGIHRFIDGISEGVARASQIIADMLTYSRRSASSFEPTSLVGLVETTLRLASHDYDLKRNYDFRKIRVLREVALSDDEIWCDRTAIEQVLLNLIRNAAQAMSRGEQQRTPQLTIRLSDDGPYIRVELADNGPGMDGETRKRIFEPFFTTKPVGEGTGLGLSVAYFIVHEQHRGSLRVESAPGRGSCFVMRLPRAPHTSSSQEASS